MAKKKTSLVDAAKRLNASREAGGSEEQKKRAKKGSSKAQTGGASRKSGSSSSSRSGSSTGGSKASGGRKSASGSKASGGRKSASGSKTRAATPAKGGAGSSAAGTGSTESAPPAKADDPREQIIAEVVEIARGLDDAGLDLLLEQAKVVRYKGQIEEFNRQLNTAAAKAADRRREANTPDYHVAIERNDDYFIIQMDDQRVFFNLNEMRELTRVSHKAKDPAAGARLLFRWFEAERSDLLADAGINSARSPYLVELYEIIVSTYKVKS